MDDTLSTYDVVAHQCEGNVISIDTEWLATNQALQHSAVLAKIKSMIWMFREVYQLASSNQKLKGLQQFEIIVAIQEQSKSEYCLHHLMTQLT